MRPNVSVCMATYNGEAYLTDQVNSILRQLDKLDELLIVDDCSTDNTVSIVNSYHDDRIKLYINDSNIGHVKAFQRALSLSTKNIILLSDQDDIWIDGRLDCLVNELLVSKCDLVSSNISLIDSIGRGLPRLRHMLHKENSDSSVSNLVGVILGTMPYYGCAMALRRGILKIALPMPKIVESHDIWLALAANLTCSNRHLDDVTVMRRIHSANLTPSKKRPLYKIFISRLIFILSIVIILWRKVALKRIGV